jgi:hypothetical protein
VAKKKKDNICRKRDLEFYLDPDPQFLLEKLSSETTPKYRQLNEVREESGLFGSHENCRFCQSLFLTLVWCGFIPFLCKTRNR